MGVLNFGNKKEIAVKQKKIAYKRKKTAKHCYNSYSLEQKRQVVDYAKNNRRNEAARQFGLDSSMIGHWVEASKSWVTELNQNCKRVGSGRAVFYPEAKKKLYKWIIEQRKIGLGVTYAIARIKMMEILKGPEMIHLYGNSVECFKTSNHWMFAFMKRFNFSRILFALEQKNPSNYPTFLTWMKYLSDGTKFPPICIFKGKKLPRNKQDLIPSGVIVWAPRRISPKKFHENGIDLAVISGGLTSVCQTLDVAINKPFKNNLRKEWHLWMVNGGAGETSADEVIIQSFKTCKISNSLNELIKYEFEMEFDKENEEELEIDMHNSQASYEEITLKDDPFFEIKLNLTIYNDNEFVYSNESGLNDDN
ncbi:pogo transposable element with KRAB domain [Rhizophagus clarus]|uniref:Pogo transposable element with KRAB domain n=1 Tax=Rhizophagus clarus TaxID=94130 RepID=A0A8H3KN00_9GLOM|nr:pogo transposable element with KRAB domain [Rhizophagus clarus]